MPQTIQLVRGSTTVSNTGNTGTTLFTVPSCIACRAITVQLNFITSVNNTTNHTGMIRHDPSGGYPSPLCYFSIANVFTGAVNLVTYDDAMPFPSTNGSTAMGGLVFGANSGRSDFTDVSMSGFVQGVGPMPRNFWLGPSDQIVGFYNPSNGGTTTIAYEFILVLYS